MCRVVVFNKIPVSSAKGVGVRSTFLYNSNTLGSGVCTQFCLLIYYMLSITYLLTTWKKLTIKSLTMNIKIQIKQSSGNM